MQGAGAILLARARAKDKSSMGGFTQDDTVGGAGVRIRDVEAEQKKYANFWVGIQRRVALQRTKGKSKPLQEAAKGQAIRKVSCGLVSSF